MTGWQSPQRDRFVHDRLPSAADWPEIIPLPNVPMDGPLNCVTQLLDRHADGAHARHPAVRSAGRSWTYGELAAHVGRLANLFADEFGIQPGNRVVIRGANSPEVVAIWLATQKIGAIAVTTMPLLRAGELAVILDLSQPALVVCAADIVEDAQQAIDGATVRPKLVTYTDEAGELFEMAARFPDHRETCPTLADDISLIGFTSGTTGRPKATVHFHRDVIAICETVGRHIVAAQPDDVFIATAPLAFTFGLGGLLVFPLHAGATSVLNARYTPETFLAAMDHYRATICFTVPTFYQQMLKRDALPPLADLRLAVSSGEALPLPVRQAWLQRTGMKLTEVLGATEMLHAFIGATGGDIVEGAIGPAIPGYEARILDDLGAPLPTGTVGRLAVRGPTGCRYLDDPRQRDYVRWGWNLTGDACEMDENGRIRYHTRYDDMIISAGYNISGIEVENALLTHEAVAECAVIGEADPDRGQVVAAHIVLRNGRIPESGLIDDLQAHVRTQIAPYKYPRRIHFVEMLPRNESGKLQRFRLRVDPRC